MDANEVYKKLKAQSAYLVNKEKELLQQIEQIKQLKAQNAKRQSNVDKLSTELEQELKDF